MLSCAVRFPPFIPWLLRDAVSQAPWFWDDFGAMVEVLVYDIYNTETGTENMDHHTSQTSHTAGSSVTFEQRDFFFLLFARSLHNDRFFSSPDSKVFMVFVVDGSSLNSSWPV